MIKPKLKSTQTAKRGTRIEIAKTRMALVGVEH